MSILVRLWLLVSLLLLNSCAQLADLTSTLMPSDSPHATTAPAKRITLLLPLAGELGESGQAVRDGFMAAYHNARQTITINIIDTNKKDLAQLYQQAVNTGADFIIGPLSKTEVQQLKSKSHISIPTLALNTVEDNQSSFTNLYELDLSPQTQAKQAALKAAQDNHHAALLVTPASTWGQTVAQAFQQQWLASGGKVVGELSYHSGQDLSEQVKQLLQFRAGNDNVNRPLSQLTNQRRQDADVILLAASPEAARQIRPLFKFYYAGSLPIYATSQIYGGTAEPLADRDLDGIIFADMPWVVDDALRNSALYQQMQEAPANYNKQLARLYAIGLDSYMLSQQFNQLSQGLNGVTGKLTRQGQRINRQLSWAQFIDGNPSLLNEPHA